MASERNMYEAQISESRMDIEQLDRELQEMKRKYFTIKKVDEHQK